MRKILDEISILPGVAGSCIFSKEAGPLCTDNQLSISKESIHTMGTHLVRLLQMGKMVGFEVRTAKFKFDKYTVVGMSLESDSVLMTICEPDANCSLVATSAGMLVDDIRKDLSQGITLNIEDVKEVTEPTAEDESKTTVQEDEVLALDGRTLALLDQIKEELAGIIGPVAGMLMEECLDEITVNGSGISSVSRLVDLLASEIEDSSQASEFKSKCHILSKQAGVLNKPARPATPATPKKAAPVDSTPEPTIEDLGFDKKITGILKRIENRLVEAIGSKAKALFWGQAVNLSLEGTPDLPRLGELVDTLAQEIENVDAATEFKKDFKDLADPGKHKKENEEVITVEEVQLSSPKTSPETSPEEAPKASIREKEPEIKETEIKLRPTGTTTRESQPRPKSGKVARAMAKNNVRSNALKTPEVDSITLKKIETSLAQVMGPFASMVMEECIGKWKQSGPAQVDRLPELINTIREDINDPTQALAFNARVNAVLQNMK